MVNLARMESRAIVTQGDGTCCVETLEVGAPGPDEVLVRILASGVCHTDFDSMSWVKALVMGHEGAVVVEAVARGVEHVAPGDSVLPNRAISCGHCFQCLRGNHALCEEQSSLAGRDPRKGHAHADATRPIVDDHAGRRLLECVKRPFEDQTPSKPRSLDVAATASS
jgi:S-(hydroxymethyl)glutathione dehydrogenase/alcohol dehydrogenase